jgi:hypothetical protein
MSRQFIGKALLVSILAACTVMAADKPAKQIAIINMGAIGNRQLAGLRSALSQKLVVEVRAASLQDPGPAGLLGYVEPALKQLTDQDVCAVIIVSRPNEAQTQLLVEPTRQYALVNVAPLGQTGDDAASDEVVFARLQKQVLRGIGYLFGVGHSQDRHALHTYCTTAEGLDALGYGFSPPSLSGFYTEAAKRGLDVIPLTIKPLLKKEAEKSEGGEGKKD